MSDLLLKSGGEGRAYRHKTSAAVCLDKCRAKKTKPGRCTQRKKSHLKKKIFGLFFHTLIGCKHEASRWRTNVHLSNKTRSESVSIGMNHRANWQVLIHKRNYQLTSWLTNSLYANSVSFLQSSQSEGRKVWGIFAALCNWFGFFKASSGFK